MNQRNLLQLQFTERQHKHMIV